MMSDWFLLKTRPRQEKRAEDHLSNQGFSAYCPRFVCRNGHEEVLFPGYIFLCQNQELALGKVSSTRGVSHFIRFGNTLATVSEALISSIKSQEKQLDGEPVFTSGQLVEFTKGPFEEYQAVYLCERGEERSIVLLKLLSASREILVETSCLRSV